MIALEWSVMNQSNISADNLPNVSEEIIKTFKKINDDVLTRIEDITGNNEAINPVDIDKIEESLTAAGCNETENINLKGALVLCRFFFPKAVAEGNAKRIIEILCEAYLYAHSFNYHRQILSEQKGEIAKKRHTENYALRNDAIIYYENNIETLKNKSAEKVAEHMISNNILLAKHRTIAGWINEYRKYGSVGSYDKYYFKNN